MITFNGNKHDTGETKVFVGAGNKMRDINFFVLYNKSSETGVILTPKIKFQNKEYDLYRDDAKVSWSLDSSCARIIQLGNIPYFDELYLEVEFKGGIGTIDITTKR